MLRLNLGYRYARSGITLMEVLAVLSTVGVLFAIGAPAIQGSREKAREAVCRGNIHQLEVAMERFILAKGGLPAPSRRDMVGGWSIDLLPYLDANQLFKTIPIGEKLDLDKLEGIEPPNVLRCPSRPNQTATAFAHYAMERRPGDSYRVFDVPITIDHPWLNALEVKFERVAKTVGPHTGGFLMGGEGSGIHLMLDGQAAD